MNRYPIAAFVVVLLSAWGSILAADPHATPAAPAATATPHATTGAGDAHAPAADTPVLPPPGIRWPAVMLIIVFGMFLAAMIVGPVVRLNMPEEVPVSHTHDESHRHGNAHGHAHGGHH